MSTQSDFDFTFRPESYWDADGLLTALVANIEGAERKRAALAYIAQGRLDELDEFLLDEKLSEELRRIGGAIHPRFMGGEYLPDTLPGEVEIARVTLASTTQDVLSVRARPAGRRIRYCVANEYETTFVIRPATSTRPLTMKQLITLMDGACEKGGNEWPGITTSHLEWNDMTDQDPYELRDFVQVTSEYYPDLEAYYDEVFENWCARRATERTN